MPKPLESSGFQLSGHNLVTFIVSEYFNLIHTERNSHIQRPIHRGCFIFSKHSLALSNNLVRGYFRQMEGADTGICGGGTGSNCKRLSLSSFFHKFLVLCWYVMFYLFYDWCESSQPPLPGILVAHVDGRRSPKNCMFYQIIYLLIFWQ